MCLVMLFNVSLSFGEKIIIEDANSLKEDVRRREHKPDGSYRFGYDTNDGHGNSHYRKETRSSEGRVTGSYGFLDGNDVFRIVDYVSDEHGYRANVRSVDNRNKSKPSIDQSTSSTRPSVGPDVVIPDDSLEIKDHFPSTRLNHRFLPHQNRVDDGFLARFRDFSDSTALEEKRPLSVLRRTGRWRPDVIRSAMFPDRVTYPFVDNRDGTKSIQGSFWQPRIIPPGIAVDPTINPGSNRRRLDLFQRLDVRRINRDLAISSGRESLIPVSENEDYPSSGKRNGQTIDDGGRFHEVDQTEEPIDLNNLIGGRKINFDQNDVVVVVGGTQSLNLKDLNVTGTLGFLPNHRERRVFASIP
ncbi:Uncharacterised protein g1362 [Pycnogonum litorale]